MGQHLSFVLPMAMDVLSVSAVTGGCWTMEHGHWVPQRNGYQHLDEHRIGQGGEERGYLCPEQEAKHPAGPCLGPRSPPAYLPGCPQASIYPGITPCLCLYPFLREILPMLGGNHQGTDPDNYHLPFFFLSLLYVLKKNIFPDLFSSYSFSKSQAFASEPGEKTGRRL